MSPDRFFMLMTRPMCSTRYRPHPDRLCSYPPLSLISHFILSMADIQTTLAASSPAAELSENAPLTPAEELTALRFKVSSLSKLALDVTRLCIEINGKFRCHFFFIFFSDGVCTDDMPHVVKSHVDAAVAKAAREFNHCRS
jgi:hypothetical protein